MSHSHGRSAWEELGAVFLSGGGVSTWLSSQLRARWFLVRCQGPHSADSLTASGSGLERGQAAGRGDRALLQRWLPALAAPSNPMGALLGAGGRPSRPCCQTAPSMPRVRIRGSEPLLQGAAARERPPWGPLGRAPLPRAPDGSLPECGPPTQAGGEPRLPHARQLPGAACRQHQPSL